MKKITFLGTGHGIPKYSVTSAIFVEDEGNNILLDTSGGHEIVVQFHKAGRNPAEVKNIFLSHYDSDHILGIIPLFRIFSHAESIKRTLFCSPEVKAALDTLFTHTANIYYKKALRIMTTVIISNGMGYEDKGWKFTFFDKKSNKTPEFGCSILFPDKTMVSFTGDEPLQEHELPFVKNSDILIHEAFCLEKDIPIYEPHPKNHSTVKEAAINAVKANAKKLVLFHMEDDTLDTRKKDYYEEARQYFNGEIFVPVDLNILKF